MSLTNDPMMGGCVDRELQELKDENKRLKEVLEYYANPENYKAYYEKNASVMIEKGERARIVLLSVNE